MTQMSIEAAIRQACRLEVLARKPGNVHPQASFDDMTCDDLLRSAELVAPILAATAELGLGAAIFEAVRTTYAVLEKNTNLGIILLLAPLAAVRTGSLAQGVAQVLAASTVEDARFVYRAIRLANPGGIGRVEAADVLTEPTASLTQVMRLAAERDRVAAQYAGEFRDVFELAVPALLRYSRRTGDWEQSIVGLHLTLMARWPDTLIARKCGNRVAVESARRASAVLDAGWPETDSSETALKEFDEWLRGDGHRRNPGTTADLVAATIYIALREENWTPPGMA